MRPSINAAFDSGNIEVVAQTGPAAFDLTIRKDHQSDFYQWFHFRLSGAAGHSCTLRIVNAGGAAYPYAWAGYRACYSEDRQTWTRLETHYADGVLTINVTPTLNAGWIAYFAPYSMERHHDLIARMAVRPGVTLSMLGETLDGQPLDCLSITDAETPARKLWLIARQHPGETMAEWWMEGLLERLTDPADALARKLRRQHVFHIVPNMNPDGSRRGHLRTNAVGTNLNREWQTPTLERSPEVYRVLEAMHRTGVDFCLDVHGDEALPHNFIAGFEGIPSITDHQLSLLARYKAALAALNPDFQTRIGYEIAKSGAANMTMCTNAVAEAFGCLAMTLEMPFKDADDNPDPIHGWSPERSKHLGRSCLDALAAVIDDLRA